ncbi:MAG: DUF1287 domain-containing protein [Hyphomicrobiales bacterium]
MVTRRNFLLSALGVGTLVAGIALATPTHRLRALAQLALDPEASPPPRDMPVFTAPDPWAARLVAGAEDQIGRTLNYDPAYERIAYPEGDVPIERGVCTDVVIRAYRFGLSVDLQKLVHEDMAKNFAAYPALWGLTKPDSNIDHRRVPNLQAFFRRAKASLPVSDDPRDYRPGDVVTQKLSNGLAHIVLVTHRASDDGARPLVVHNIGAGARLEDVLFAFTITGHYRFAGTI